MPRLRVSSKPSTARSLKNNIAKTPQFVCAACGAAQSQWLGQCPSCNEWGTIEEKSTKRGGKSASVRLSDVDAILADRVPTKINEFDRVLGGGIVKGSVILLAGEPGIGKSTLALQTAVCFKKTLYVAGEESAAQIKLRADRLQIDTTRIMVTADGIVESLVAETEREKPDLIIVDSIQTMRVESPTAGMGAVNQIREATAIILRTAKSLGIPAVIVGHVTKSGDVAGPMLLEHLVDVVLFLEQDTSGSFRMLRGMKNRFGATDDVGLFAMSETGMRDVSNPSELLLPGGPATGPGSAAVASMEGRRPLVIELQALTVPTTFGNPRRLSTGVDPNRLAMLLAVLERRGGIIVSADDVYLNSAGGFRLKETAIDLGIIAAVASAARDRALSPATLFCGEVGLGGEIRAVSRIDARLKEAAVLGFKKAFIPRQKTDNVSGMDLIPVGTIEELLCLIP